MFIFSRRNKKDGLSINFKAKEITLEYQMDTEDIESAVRLLSRKNNIPVPVTRELVGRTIILRLSDGWKFTDKSLRTYHKKDKRRFSKEVEMKRDTISESYNTRNKNKK